MSTKKPITPLELLRDRLAGRPTGTRAVLVADPHNLIDWPRSLADRKGREWQVVLYRGDDCVTRRAWRRAWNDPAPVCLVLSRPVGDGQPLNVSALADLVARCEGELVDLSLPGYFHTLFPKINPPLAALAEFREAFIAHVAEIQKAYPQFKARFPEPDSWSRGQFLAVLAISQTAGLTLEDVWCDDVEYAAFTAHAVWLLCHPSVKPEHLRLISEVIWESSRKQRGDALCAWLDVAAADLDGFRNELAVYLVSRDALAAAVEHVDALLAAKLRCHTFDPMEVGGQAAALTAALKDGGRWADVQTRADEALLDGRLRGAGELIAGNEAAANEMMARPDSSVALVALLAREALLGRMRGGQAWPPWAGAVPRHRLLAQRSRSDLLTAAQQAAAALLSAIDELRQVENALATPLLPFGSAEELLDWYVRHEFHLLELRGAEALARLETLDDAELRGVIDDLRRRVQPGDIILLTSDHGFQELFDDETIVVSRAAARSSGATEDDVAYRYLRFQPSAKPPKGKHVKLDWEELGHDGKRQTTKFTLPVGGTWYQREGGRPARFAHGGISLAEMVIPAVLMRAIERKTARVEFAELPRDANVNEDESLTLSFELVNTGNIDTQFELVVATNLGEVLLEERGQIVAAKRLGFSCRLVGRYESDRDRMPIADRTTSAVLLKLSHGDIDGRMVRPGYGDELVRVHVKPKPTKIDTDVLRAFDDL